MKPNTLLTTGILSAVFGLAAAEPASAQVHIDLGVSRHRQGFNLVSPHGTRVVDHHDTYRYVVPPAHHSQGTFYTHEDRHYYTAAPPAPPVVVVQQVPPPAPPRPVAMEFGSFRHYEDLATRLEALMNQFCLDLHYNYQHNPGYAEAYREAYKLLQAAKYLHGKDHQGDHATLQRSGSGVDELFHHVQEEVRGWRSGNQRQVGQFSLAAKTEELEALIHHLLFDIGVKPAHDDEAAPAPLEEAPPPAAEPRSIRIPISQP